MINIIICDDEKIFAKELEKIINELQLKEKYLITIYTSASELQESILEGQKCDILFMDIELEGNIKGTDVASNLKEICTEMLIIYVSSYNTYYESMVQADSFRFLTKPITKTIVENALMAALKRMKKYEYTYRFNREVNVIDLKDVVYIYSDEKKVYIHFKSGQETSFYSKLDTVEQEIEGITDTFIRVNKSYIINFNTMRKYKIDKICVKDNNGLIELTIGRKYKESVSKKYTDNVLEKVRQ